ncbi:hypothetical protein BH24ACI2_BH24ACI2_01900 [soil metagenome]
MKYISILSIIISIFIASALNGAAQSPSKILKQAGKSLGGERVLQNLKSSRKTGRITRLTDGASGKFQMQAAEPNFYNAKFDLNGFETETGYNGKSGWMRDSRDGLRTLTGETGNDFQAEAIYRNSLWLDYKKQKAKIVSGGQAIINGKPTNSIILTTPKGTAIKMYFDVANGLLIREEIPAGELTKTFDYSDYRFASGIREPFTIKAKIGADAYEIKLNKIIHHQQIATSNFDFPKISGKPLPDIPTLLKQVQANGDKIEDILENYSYTQKIISRELGKDGILHETGSATNQLSFYKGYRISRLIEKNGRPLSPAEQADEDKNVQKRVAEIEKKIAKQEAKTSGDEAKRISIAETLRASNLINPRRERFRGRDVIVFDFEPNPNFDLKNAKSLLKFFGKVGGAIWIDEQDKQVIRIESSLFDNFKYGGVLVNVKKGSSFMFEQERVNDEIWLPSLIEINAAAKVLLFKGVNFNQIIKSDNYQKFTTEVKSSKIDEVKQP